jgi:hypothetical protein
MSKYFKHVYSAWGLVLLCSVGAGCGAGAYEKRLNARIQEIRQEAIAGLQKADLPEVQLALYVPEGMKIQAADASRPGKPSLSIFNDQGLPTLKYTCTASTPPDESGDQLPYYCYVGVCNPGVGVNLDSIFAAISDKLSTQYPGKPANAFDVPCRTIDGREVICKRITLENLEKEFTYKGKKNVSGMLEIYLRPIDVSVVVIAWRFPSHLKEYLQLGALGPRVAGTVSKEN